MKYLHILKKVISKFNEIIKEKAKEKAEDSVQPFIQHDAAQQHCVMSGEEGKKHGAWRKF
jgi:hypothetical protein